MDEPGPGAHGPLHPRFAPYAGAAVGEPFRGFFAQVGETLCGAPVSDVLVENGRRCQYFEHLALEEIEGGRVRIKPLGRAWIEARAARAEATVWTPPRPRIVDLTAELARHAVRCYPARPLADIRFVVLHHTGASSDVGPPAIAEEHVRVNDWPGIGYHFVIDHAGVIYQTQDLTTVSHHARQFNPVAAGVALTGQLGATLPTSEQMDALTELLAHLLADLGLGAACIRGHREMVPTTCPGDTFLTVWKPRLLRQVARRLDPRAAESPAARPSADAWAEVPAPEDSMPDADGTLAAAASDPAAGTLETRSGDQPTQ